MDLVESFCIIGDLNSRFGTYVRNLPRLSDLSNNEMYTYPTIPDPVERPNDNAYILSSFCVECKLLVLNNLKVNEKHFVSKKTYRKGNEWLSELDTCVVCLNMLKNINDFHVVRNDCLPSDHAPVSLMINLPGVDMEHLVRRASQLADHAVLHEYKT